jgi:hypothetical protein
MHSVIEGKSLPDYPTRLVPVSKVGSTSQDHITLSCTKEELTKMPPFIVSNFIHIITITDTQVNADILSTSENKQQSGLQTI